MESQWQEKLLVVVMGEAHGVSQEKGSQDWKISPNPTWTGLEKAVITGIWTETMVVCGGTTLRGDKNCLGMILGI